MERPEFSFSRASPDQRRTLIAASLGWMLDAFDVMLFALVLTYIMNDLGMSRTTAGLLGTLTSLASGVGGILFGYVADIIGRKRGLMLSILTYSLCSFACGLVNSIWALATFRFLLGLGMGGEWNTGAALVAETWPAESRAKALSIVQSSWAWGYAAAALVAGFLLRYYNWRVVFFAGVLPGLVVLWIRTGVPESTLWQAQHARDHANAPAADAAQIPRAGIAELFSPQYLRATLALLGMNFFGLFAWWGLFIWVPNYLESPIARGGRGFDVALTTTMLVVLNLTGMFPGYLAFGWFADRIGRRKSFILFTLLAAVLVPLYALARNPIMFFLLGSPLAFFGTGFFSGSSITGSEVFPTALRARALGVTYNGARALSSIAPAVIGFIGQRHGLSAAFLLCAAAFFLASLAATQLPETRGQALT
jgi:MFS family permease